MQKFFKNINLLPIKNLSSRKLLHMISTNSSKLFKDLKFENTVLKNLRIEENTKKGSRIVN